MNMILHNPEILTVEPATQPVPPVQQTAPQFQQMSPTALRQRISELTSVQDELKERLRRQEQATRNAIGVGVLSTVLAATAIGITFWTRTTNSHSGSYPVAARQTPPTYPVLASMR